MAKEILVNVAPQEKRVAIVNDGRLEEFYIERPQDKNIVGNIYKGRIDTVVPSLNAAFVDLALEKKGFLYLSDIEDTIEPVEGSRGFKRLEVKKDDEVLIQVVKEPFGTKGPRITTHIGLAGRYFVLTPLNTHKGISRRIEEDAERKRLRQILESLKLPDDLGFIVRTEAKGKSKAQLQQDALFLIKLWGRIKKAAERAKAPSLVYEEYDLVLRVIRDSFTEETQHLIVDSIAEYHRTKRFIHSFLGHMARKVEFYREANLFTKKDIENQINRIFEAKVYLKSKAYLVIEPTEGLVVIDVNSGGFKKGTDPEEAAFKVNNEAAVEAARQLRLRDLGGIIIIDFIDMEKEGHRRQIFNTLNHELSKDRAKYDVLGISKFGVVEMTRERIHRSVAMLSYQECPYCQGKGRVKSPLTVAIDAWRQLEELLMQGHNKAVTLAVNPLVHQELLKETFNFKALERKFKANISLLSNPSYHLEEVKIS
jgi:ribonuclease G